MLTIHTNIPACSLTTDVADAAVAFIAMVEKVITPEVYLKLLLAISPEFAETGLKILHACLGTPA